MNMPTVRPQNLELVAAQVAIVLVPSFSVAWLTGNIVWVVPTVVAAGLAANAIDTRDSSWRMG